MSDRTYTITITDNGTDPRSATFTQDQMDALLRNGDVAPGRLDDDRDPADGAGGIVIEVSVSNNEPFRYLGAVYPARIGALMIREAIEAAIWDAVFATAVDNS